MTGDSTVQTLYGGPVYGRSTSAIVSRRLYSLPAPQDEPYSRPNFIIRIFSAIGRFFRNLFGIREPVQPAIVDRETLRDTIPSSPSSLRLLSHRQALMSHTSIGQQMSYLNNTVLPEVNNELPSALQEFNRQSNLSLTCTGITPGTAQLPLGLVFTAFGSNPARILLSDTELTGKNKEEIVRLIEQRVREHRTLFLAQNRIWTNSPARFNPERGRTSFVGICIPGNITGLENDYSELIHTVWGGVYNANIRGVCMQNTSVWNSLRRTNNLPAAAGTTRTEILDTISNSVQQAMASNDTSLVIGLTGHGNQNGTMQISNGQLSPGEIIQRIASELRRNPNSSLRNYHFIVESCFSDAQREEYERSIRELLSEFSNISVSVTVSSDRHTESSAGSNSGNSAHINPRITGSNSGTLSRNLSLAYQINPDISLSDALRWVDLNARLDSYTRQNMQGYFFRRGERSQYTRHDDAISENPYSPNPVTTLALY